MGNFMKDIGVSYSDKVHAIGMSEDGSTHLTVSEFDGAKVEPPIKVVLEGEDSQQVAIYQDVWAARYDNDELSQIGEGNPTLGLKRVIGDVAVNGPLVEGATKPLHPNLFDANASVVAPAELPGPHPDLIGNALVIK